MADIKLLDCTLRDGGHVVSGKFGNKVIKTIISDLVKSRVDIIEAGFLWEFPTDENTARYHTISELKKFLPDNLGTSKISLMADNVELSHLEPYDGTVEIIRLSFRKNEFEWATRNARLLKEKGYKVYINTIHGSSFTDEEYLDIIHKVNEIKPYGFSIVDTFGAMRQNDLGRIYYLVEHNLNKDIALGIHLHENLGLAYSLAQYILSIAAPTRKITIDASLYGMGKIPGNLCIEQMMDFMNVEYGTSYYTEPVYDAIDDYIMPIYNMERWGYSIPYALSAQCGVHRTYAEHLINKDRLHTKDICRILKSIDLQHSEIFNKEYIENIYRNYVSADYAKSNIRELEDAFRKFDKFVLIAPGASLKNYTFNDEIFTNACTISINFILDTIETDFMFFSNIKRLQYAGKLDLEKTIITSNLLEDLVGAKYVLSRNDIAYHDELWSEDSTLMMLNILKSIGVKNVFVAGFDGFKNGTENFYENGLERVINTKEIDLDNRFNILRKSYSAMNIQFLTPSIYEEVFK